MHLRPSSSSLATMASMGTVVAIMACGSVANDPDAYDPNAIIFDLLVDPEYPETGATTTFTVSAD
jgi:hypothetical protein